MITPSSCGGWRTARCGRPTTKKYEVWLLFPETQRVVRYTAPFEATILHADDELSTPLAPDFRMRVADLFAVE